MEPYVIKVKFLIVQHRIEAFVLILALIIGLSVNSVNPFFLLFIVITFSCAYYAFTSIPKGIYAFIIIASFSNLFKRLLFIAEKEVSNFYYYGIVFLPDIIFFIILLNVFWQTSFTKKLKVKLSFPILLFFSWNILSIINPLSPYFTKIAGIKLFSIYVLAFYIGYAYAQEINLKEIKYLISVILIVGVISSLYGISQFYIKYFGYEKEWLESGKASIGLRMLSSLNIFRAFSIFSGVSEFALFMGLCLLFSVFVFFISPKKRYIILLIPIFLIGMILSLCRGVWFGFFLGLMTIFLYQVVKINYKLVLVLFLALLIFVFAFQREKLYQLERIGRESSNPVVTRALVVGTFYSRLNLWSTIKENLLENKHALIFGYGIGSKSSAAKFALENKESLKFINLGADNMYLQMIFEIGIIGLILFLFVVWRFFNNISFVFKKIGGSWVRYFILISLGYTILILIDGILDATLDLRPLNFLFWLFLGILEFLRNKKQFNRSDMWSDK